MNANALPWDDLRIVLAIGRDGTLSGAARTLGLNHSTVFRRLGALEQRLGVRLFERFRDGYAPTAAGEEIVALAKRVDADVTALERRLAGKDLRPSGVVRVTTTDTLIGLLTPVAAAFRAAHPEVVLELVVSGAVFNLSKRDADVALRPAANVPDSLVGRRLATIAWTIYGAADYLARRSARVPHEKHDWIGYDDSLSHLAAARWLKANVPEARIGYRANTLIGVLEAARAGLGLVILPCYMGDAAAELRRIRAPMPEMETGLWLLTHSDLRKVARVRAFLDFVAPAIAARRTLFEGKQARRSGG